MSENEKRISLSIKMPSVSLMNFIEKVLQDDMFFKAAVENPLEVLKENGIRLDVKSLTPRDLSTFLGALAGAKELIKKRQIKDIKFENVFGKVAEVRGSTIIRETNMRIHTDFNKDTFLKTNVLSSTTSNFAGQPVKDPPMEGTVSFSHTNTGVSFHFDANRGIGSSTGSSIDTYTTTSFAELAKMSFMEDILNGPLITPVDLVNIAAQINTYVDIAEHMEGE